MKAYSDAKETLKLLDEKSKISSLYKKAKITVFTENGTSNCGLLIEMEIKTDISKTIEEKLSWYDEILDLISKWWWIWLLVILVAVGVYLIYLYRVKNKTIILTYAKTIFNAIHLFNV
jgi:hypothetical protein